MHAALAPAGFDVEEAEDGFAALAAMDARAFDLVILDIKMPGMDGVETCRRIRSRYPHTGILMVTVQDSEDDKVGALEAGADDFITKPFRLRELTARMRSVLRRTKGGEAPAKLLAAGNVRLDLERRVVYKSNVEIHLSPTEFDLLACLMQHAGAPVTHVKLLRSVWGPEYGGELEYLRSYIRMLRKKIEDQPASPEYILTEAWVGYRFRNPSDNVSAA